MSTVEIFEPALCCKSGICGPRSIRRWWTGSRC
ncbi:arsenic metallochaperone ArsD family protein [Nocardia seriolae]|nr:arsenic metallochaperone ArsD family protein [Nocardia seriolae]WKY55499.1 arsenic metallochaperone ArsD family protein [Nocardia seriolae]WNJ56028.1 arsenic metallochaperone ArsD family protein [Nocardia seriolae]